jgi:quercetin dioxygenase-like cupin family protein
LTKLVKLPYHFAMIIKRTQEVPAIESPNGNHGTAIATPSVGATEVSVVRQRQIPGGFNPAHSHNVEEVMVMLEGSVTVSAPEENVVIHAGDAVILAAGVLHRVENTGTINAEWLIVSKAGVKFFRENGDEAVPGWAK